MKLVAAVVTTVALMLTPSVDTTSHRTGTQDTTLVSKHLEIAHSLAAMSFPTECVPENGYDYVGNTSATHLGCNGLLQHLSSKAGCNAYSWSSLNGGTCWLKTGRDTIVVNANVKSVMVIHPGPGEIYPCGSYNLELNTDYVGNDSGYAPSTKPEDFSGCKALSWTNESGGTCYFKNCKGATVANANVQSAVV